MTEKDIAEKDLESYNDVFADIVNVLLFGGRRVVQEESLSDARSGSSYKADDGLHTQDRDVAKYWKESASGIRIALYGFENQTKEHDYMPLRVIGYDGAAYREQLLKKEQEKPCYPVVTLVLYFGEKRWSKARTLYECIDVKEDLKPYVNDYRINLFEIAYLTDDQVKMFRSDFRFIADYFVQVRKNKSYVPSQEEIRHVDGTFQLMKVLTGDNRFEETLARVENKGGRITMYDAFADAEKRGIALGKEQGIALGKEQGKEEMVINMLANNIPPETVAKCAGLSLERVKEIQNKNNSSFINLF